MSKPVLKESEISITIKDVFKKHTLNYTDIVGNSNKCYSIEGIEATDGKFFIYTQYGRVAGTLAKEYRVCDDKHDAEKEIEKIIKSKVKKGYVEVKLVQASVGSEVGKSKIEPNTVSADALKKMGVKVSEEPSSSKLHTEVADLVRTWFGITQEFIELNLDTSRCPLGQLSLDQITKGKDILEEARKIVHMKKPDVNELNKITNLFYSNIPHNFSYRRINADALRFDSDDKIDKAMDVLDVFGDAKDVEKVISKKSAVDAQYATLNADLEWIDPSEATWKWLNTMLLETRANNHSALGKIKLHKVWRLNRHKEDTLWLETAEKIAKDKCKWQPAPVYSKLVENRPDVPKELASLYKAANILPGWHGTRRANMIGITKHGLLIRPSGVVHAGSMYGDAIYVANQSSKSINYCDIRGSYWAQGTNKTAYLFLMDAAFGNQKIADGSRYYTKQSISPHHSVWAKGGQSGVINDELMLYAPSGQGQQHKLRYILEFETQVR